MTHLKIKTTLLSIAVLAATAALNLNAQAHNLTMESIQAPSKLQFVLFAAGEQLTLSDLVKQIKRSIQVQKKNGLIGPLSIYASANPGSLDEYIISSAINSLYEKTGNPEVYRVSSEMMYASWNVGNELYQATFFENGRGH